MVKFGGASYSASWKVARLRLRPEKSKTAALLSSAKSSEWAISFPVDERMATKRIGIVGYNGVTALDIVGPLEAFATASYGSPERVGRRAYEVMIIGLIDAPFTAESGLLFQPHKDFTSAPNLDTLIIPGGTGLRQPDINKQVSSLIKFRASRTRRIVSVC